MRDWVEELTHRANTMNSSGLIRLALGRKRKPEKKKKSSIRARKQKLSDTETPTHKYC